MSTTPTTVPTHLVLSPHHQELLMDSAVPVEFALAAGVRTVALPDDLPEGLEWLAGQVPGLLFQHQTMDGRHVAQYRPDRPADADRKYVFAVGAGSVLSVHPSMRDRIDTAERAVIVEGTKQALAVAAVAPDDVLVVGIQGCTAWSRNGVPLPELDRLARRADGTARMVTVWFDADWSSNADVWASADRLVRHLRTVGAAEVRLVRMGAGAKSGADDYLAEREDRATAVANLLEQATDKLGRKPKSKVRPTAAGQRDRLVVDWDQAQVREPDTDKDGIAIPGQVVADFAMRIATSAEVIDELNADPRTGAHSGVDHDIELVVGTGDSRERWVIRNVSDLELSGGRSVNAKAGLTDLLRRVPGGAGTRLWWKASAADAILAACRAASADAPTTVTATHTGYHQRDGVWGYLHNRGFITADGHSEACRAQLEGSAAKIAYDAADRVGSDDLRADVTEVVELLGAFLDPTSWIALEGAAFYALLGAPPECVPNVIGQPGSGKTTLAWAWQAHAGTALHDQAMFSPNSTAGALGAVGAGIHQGLALVDDVLTGSVTGKAVDDRLTAIDALSRRGYAGGSVGRQRLAANTTGLGRSSYRTELPDAARPLVVMVGEFLPPANRRSLRERLLGVPVTYETLFAGGEGVSRLEAAAAGGAMNRATGGFIRWVVARIEEAGGVEAFVEQVVARRKAIAAKLADEFPGTLGAPEVHERARLVPAGPIVGWSEWTAFALEAGAIDEARARELVQLGFEVIGKLAASQATELGADTTPHGDVLARLRQAVAAGRATWIDAEAAAAPGVPVIGKRHVAPRALDGIHVALLPDQVAQVLGMSVSGPQLRTLLAPVASSLHHKVKLGGEVPDAVLIPESTWQPEAAAEEDLAREGATRNEEY